MKKWIAIALAAASVALAAQGHPECWEDEVVVMVVHDPYDQVDEHFGCVAADHLPVKGYRPGDDVNTLANS